MEAKTEVIEPPCFRCIHLIYWPTCTAFPDGIPNIIKIEGDKHINTIPGDHGIRFKEYKSIKKTAPKGGAPGSRADSLRRIRTRTARKQK